MGPAEGSALPQWEGGHGSPWIKWGFGALEELGERQWGVAITGREDPGLGHRECPVWGRNQKRGGGKQYWKVVRHVGEDSGCWGRVGGVGRTWAREGCWSIGGRGALNTRRKDVQSSQCGAAGFEPWRGAWAARPPAGLRGSPAPPQPALAPSSPTRDRGGGWLRRSCPRGWGWRPDGLAAVPADGRALKARWCLQAHGLRPPLPRPEGREEGDEITLSQRDRESP